LLKLFDGSSTFFITYFPIAIGIESFHHGFTIKATTPPTSWFAFASLSTGTSLHLRTTAALTCSGVE
jgi:hypothetical protein